MTEEERKKLELQQQKQNQNQQNQTSGQNMQQNNLAMQPSNTVTQAQNYLNNQIKPNATPYTQQVYNLYNQLQQRPAGTFDPYGSQGWQYYKNLYTQAGQKAMQDTVAQINQSTGGYGNSYAGAVGQQTYQDYLREMLGAMPEYAQMEYDQMANNAQMGMDSMKNAYALATDMLARGIMPDDYILQMSGLTQEQARKLMPGGSAGNGGGEKKGIIPNIANMALNGMVNLDSNIFSQNNGNKFFEGENTWQNQLVDQPRNMIQDYIGGKNSKEYKALKEQYTNYSEKELDELYKILYK